MTTVGLICELIEAGYDVTIYRARSDWFAVKADMYGEGGAVVETVKGLAADVDEALLDACLNAGIEATLQNGETDGRP